MKIKRRFIRWLNEQIRISILNERKKSGYCELYYKDNCKGCPYKREGSEMECLPLDAWKNLTDLYRTY